MGMSGPEVPCFKNKYQSTLVVETTDRLTKLNDVIEHVVILLYLHTPALASL
jgi:hypothetical protein